MAKKKEALQQIRDAIADARIGLSPTEDHDLLEELVADAEGWKMELDESDDED